MLQPHETLFLLVHDAWHGAWAWRDVTAYLNARGWSSAALDLPGRTPTDPPGAASLTYYAEAVEQVARQWTRGKVVLVGHGLAGPVLQLAAERLGDLVGGLIFVSAYVLNDSETVADQLPPEMSQFFAALAEAHPQKRLDLAQFADFWRTNLINDAPERAEEILAKLVPEPIEPFFEKISLPDFFQNRPPCAYLVFNEDISLPPGELYPRQAAKLGSYRQLYVSASHEGLLTHPREVAEAFVFLAAQVF